MYWLSVIVCLLLIAMAIGMCKRLLEWKGQEDAQVADVENHEPHTPEQPVEGSIVITVRDLRPPVLSPPIGRFIRPSKVPAEASARAYSQPGKVLINRGGLLSPPIAKMIGPGSVAVGAAVSAHRR